MTAEELKEIKEALGSNKSVLTKHLGQIITVVVLSAGIVGGWYTNKAEVAQLQKDVAKQEKVLEKYGEQIDNAKLEAVESKGDIKHIKEKVDKMDEKLDKLLGN